MPSFLRVFRRDTATKSKKNVAANTLVEPPKPKWEDPWFRKDVEPEEVQELIHVCTQEMKSRALDMPFLLLPFRPGLDTIGAKNFIRQYFRARYDGQVDPKSLARRELMLMEPIVLCSIMKWCWSRLPGGVVTWETYDLFKTAEVDSKMAKNAFEVFIPMSTESDARREIIFDFFDLLAAVAARGKTNGLGGRKLSRYAGWWAFEHSDGGKGFDGGYKSWLNAADATSHLFFAYLRSLAPKPENGVSGISKLPRSLQSLLSQTEYPPEAPSLMYSTTPKVVMIVENVSPTPFALLRRARNFEYREDDRVLQEFSSYDDPVRALTDECRRVVESISSTNQSVAPVNSTGTQDASWSRFEDFGFSSLSDGLNGSGDLAVSSGAGHTTNLGRPTTPSWADFLSSGFHDDKSPTLLPPDKQLPLPVVPNRGHSSQSHRPGGAQADLEPGELASIAHFDLDETFWWVWMTSLAPEEPAERKAVFGRCALIETDIRGASWLIIEEQVKGASPGQEDGAYIAEKKSFFSRRGRLTRRKTTVKKEKKVEEPPSREITSTPSNKIGPEQHAKIQKAAAQLAKGQQPPGTQPIAQRRSRLEEDAGTKTISVLTLQPGIITDAGPALTWASRFDSGAYEKEDIRQRYLNDPTAGTGKGLNGHSTSKLSLHSNGAAAKPIKDATNRELPDLPTEEISSAPLKSSSSLALSTVQKSQTNLAQPLIGDEKPSITDHPALRSSSVVEPPEASAANPPPVERKPAAIKPKSPNKLHKKEPQPGGFKKLFGRKKSVVHEPTTNESLPAIVRKPKSQMIEVPTAVVDPEPVAQPPAPEPKVEEAKNVEPTFAEPALEPSFELEESSGVEREQARQAALDQLEADREFARFDHGPEETSYAAEDEDDGDAAPPPVVKPAPGNRAAGMLHPEDVPRQKSHKPIVIPSIDNQTEGSNGESYSDRWAQLRKNAAERAQRLNEEQSSTGVHKRQPSQGRNSDDGETSGEETIESRVARIKARVAELTGNMDSARP